MPRCKLCRAKLTKEVRPYVENIGDKYITEDREQYICYTCGLSALVENLDEIELKGE